MFHFAITAYIISLLLLTAAHAILYISSPSSVREEFQQSFSKWFSEPIAVLVFVIGAPFFLLDLAHTAIHQRHLAELAKKAEESDIVDLDTEPTNNV